MSKYVCRFCKDEFCVNADCPMRADYCPVPDMPGVCKHEDRIEIYEQRSPKECLADTFNECGEEMRESEVENIFNKFVEQLAKNNYHITNINPENKTSFYPGQLVHIDVIRNSNEWTILGFGNNDIECYCTTDRTMSVTYQKGQQLATIMRAK